MPKSTPRLGLQLYSIAGAKPDATLEPEFPAARSTDSQAVGIQPVISGHGSLPVVAIGQIEGQHPPPRQAVLPGCIGRERTTRLSLPAESLSCAIDTDIVYVRIDLENACSLSKRMRKMRPSGSQKYVWLLNCNVVV